MRLNIGGYKWLNYDGYDRLSLKLTQALIRLGHDIYPFDLSAPEQPSWYMQAQGLSFDKPTVQIAPPSCAKNLPGRSIIFTMHESGTLPDSWTEYTNGRAQWMLAPSNWIKEVFIKNSVKIPIEVVPPAIDPDECQLVFRNKNRPYTFGCLADRANRKGYDLVYSAFYKAFAWNNKDVHLTVKCMPTSLPRLDASYSSDTRFTVWKANVENIADIYAQMDAYIFPTRCEGLGMPPREAAACGVPVLCTNWSGTADDIENYATPLNEFKLFESNMEGCGGTWAEPSLDEIIWRMRDMYEHQDEYKAKALKAAQWLRENRTYAHAAKSMVSTLAEWLGVPPPKEEPVHLGHSSVGFAAGGVLPERHMALVGEPGTEIAVFNSKAGEQ